MGEWGPDYQILTDSLSAETKEVGIDDTDNAEMKSFLPGIKLESFRTCNSSLLWQALRLSVKLALL